MKQFPEKIKENYFNREIMWYDGSKPENFFLGPFQNLRYFSVLLF